jgi:hypothetical protein
MICVMVRYPEYLNWGGCDIMSGLHGKALTFIPLALGRSFV